MNPIPGPVILLGLPLLAAVLAYVVRRFALVAALIATLTSAGLAVLCLILPLGQSAFVLGREVAFGRPIVIANQTLVLDPAGQMWLAFAFALAPILYLFAWRMSQGRSFFSFSLLVLTFYSLVVMLPSFTLSLLAFAISATLTVFVIQGGQLASVRGAQRYLMVTLLAVPFVLGAAWLLEQSRLDPAGLQALLPNVPAESLAGLERSLAQWALLPAALGFGLLLAAFPFGTWMPALAADAPPLISTFVFTIGQAMALFLALLFVQDNVSTLGLSSTGSAIQLAGLVMAAAGGLMAAVQRDFGRWFGYAALADLGVLLLALGVGGSQRLTLALLYLVARSLSLALVAAALSILRHRATTDHFDRLRGVARRLPVTTVGLLLGGLALAGFPLTAGFPTHWAVYRAVAGVEWAEAGAPGIGTWILLASSVGIVVGLLRGLSAMLGGDARDDVARQPRIAAFLLVLLAGLVILLGLYPQLFLGPVQRAAEAFSLF